MRSLALVSLVLFGCDSGGPPGRPAMVPETPSTMSPTPRIALDLSEGLALPEAVLHDPVADVYLISNLNGSAHALDDNGYIARVSPDGQMIAPKWISGALPDVTLHAPRGMAIRGNTLYVVDVDAVRLFDRATGAPIEAWPVPDPQFPNDIRVAADGSVFVTETAIHLDPSIIRPQGTSTIWKFSPDGKPSVFARGEALAGPNGIVIANDGSLIVASFLGDEVYRVRQGGAPEVVSKLPEKQLDGLVELPDGTLLVTSWKGFGIYQIDPTAPPERNFHRALHSFVLLGPASIGYDVRRERLLVPLVLANQVRIETFPMEPSIATSGKATDTGILARERRPPRAESDQTSVEPPVRDTHERVVEPTRLSADELQVVAHYHEVNRLEIELGRLVQQRASRADVQAYGAMLVDHHRRNDERLRWLVSRTGQTIPRDRVTTDAERRAKQKTLQAAARLRQLSGAELDRAYLQLMIESHERELANIGANLAKVANAQLTALLEGTKPVLELHARRARLLRRGAPQAMR